MTVVILKTISHEFFGHNMTGSQGPLLALSHLRTMHDSFSSYGSNPKLLLTGRYP